MTSKHKPALIRCLLHIGCYSGKYGPIPLVPDEGFDYNQSYEDLELPRNTYDECVDYIAKEMVLAAQGLPLKRDQLSITLSYSPVPP